MTKQLPLLFLIIILFFNCKSETKTTQPQNFEESYNAGKLVYNGLCITCHLDNGKGVPKAFPPLADSDYLEKNQLESIKGIKYGMNEEITVNGIVYKGNMTNQGLTDQEIADVMNYINNSWGNQYGTFITPEQVSKISK